MDKKIYIKELNYEGDNLLRPIIGDVVTKKIYEKLLEIERNLRND